MSTPRSFRRIASGLVVGLAAWRAAPAAAQAPIQVAFVTPIQLVPQQQAVRGVRVDLLYGSNPAVQGFDIGLVNQTTRGPSSGVQLGLANLVTGDFTGLQYGFVNTTSGRVEGLQTALVNVAGSGEGMQWGLFNSNREMNGLQLALVNYAERIHGVQVGLVNIIRSGGQFPVFPIVNWGK